MTLVGFVQSVSEQGCYYPGRRIVIDRSMAVGGPRLFHARATRMRLSMLYFEDCLVDRRAIMRAIGGLLTGTTRS